VTVSFEVSAAVGANVTWKVRDWFGLRVAGKAGLKPIKANGGAGVAVVTVFTVKDVVPPLVMVTV